MAFIAFEGLDGSGKSTLISVLKKKLDSIQLEYIVTREPGGTVLAEEMRQLVIRNDAEILRPRSELLLYQAARVQHVDLVIRPNLEKKKWVISDRFTASTTAFQSGGRGIEKEYIDWLNNFATDGLIPDINVLLDITIEESQRRMLQRSLQLGQEQDRFESEKKDFHNRVREAYLSLVNLDPRKWLVLDASKSVEELSEDLMKGLASFFESNYV